MANAVSGSGLLIITIRLPADRPEAENSAATPQIWARKLEKTLPVAALIKQLSGRSRAINQSAKLASLI